MDVKGPEIRSKCEKGVEKNYKWDMVWTNVVLLGLLHLGAVYGFYLKVEALFWTHVFAKILGVMASLAICGGAHRLWCHRTYEANKACQLFWMFFATMTYQNSVYIWCRDHRLHHKYSETDADPHNANRGFFFSHVGWLMVRKHEDVKEKGKTIDLSDLEANPIVMFQHKYYYVLVFLLTVCITTFVPWYFWGESLKVAFFSATIYRYIMAVNHTWFINSLAHLYGNKPYDKAIGPVESPFMMFFGGGEGFHNYHHTFPWDYKASESGSDGRNWTTFLIDCFASIGWVTNRKSVPQSIIDRKIERTGDGTYRKTDTTVHRLFGLSVRQETLTNLKNNAVIVFYLAVIM